MTENECNLPDEKILPRINNFYFRGNWSWNILNNTCSICRNYIHEPSTYSNCNNNDGVIGKCKHGFHKECISKWLINHNTCPNCNTEWVVQ